MSLRIENHYLRSEIQMLNDSLRGEIHVTKNQNQKLMEQNQTLTRLRKKTEDLRRDIQMLNSSLRGEILETKNQNQKLIKQNQTLSNENGNLRRDIQMLNGSLRGEIRVIKNQNQKLIKQNQTLLRQNKELKDQIQKLTDQNQLSVDQNKKLTKDNEQLRYQVEQHETKRVMIIKQVKYIKKWMDPIGKLEEHIHHVIRYCKLKKKFYAGSDEMDRLRRLITYDVDEGDDEIIVPKAVELIMKFKEECYNLMNALSSMDFETMRYLQYRTTTDEIEGMMDNFLVEIGHLQSQRREYERQRANAQRNAVPTRSTGSSNTGLQINSLAGIAIDVGYRFLKWVGGWLFS